MPSLIVAIIAGAIAGLVASAVMNFYQAQTAFLFGLGDSDEEPATVKAADEVSKAATGAPVAKPNRMPAGELVHYGTGLAVGIVYGALVLYWPTAAIGFGAVFGIVVAIVLDYIAVPLFGWGPPAWQTPLATHLYGVSSHIVFGLVMEGTRRLVTLVF